MGQTVQFNGSNSTPIGGITNYQWSFGDSSTGSGATPTHAYSSPGNYTATLTATGKGGTRRRRPRRSTW